MSIAVIEGFGTTVGYSATLGGTYTSLGEVLDVDMPDTDVSDIKTTHMGSASHTHTYQAGLVEPGEMKVVIHWDKTEFGVLDGLIRASKFWKVTLSDGTTWVQAGYIKKRSGKIKIDDVNGCELVIKMSGAVTYTAGA